MTSVASLVSRTRNLYLSPGRPEKRNKLASDITDSDTTLTFSYGLNGIADGSVLSIGLEKLHVWTSDKSLKQADVDRGQYGTAAAAASAGDIVLVDPQYADADILTALNAAVSSLTSEGIYATGEVEITHLTSVNGYDLTGSSNVLGLLETMVESLTTSAKQWTRVPRVRRMPNANTADFASGTAIFIDQPLPNNATVRVRYKHELTANLTALTEDVESITGLESDAMDLLCISAALHLTAGKEIALNETDAARPRRSSDTPPGTFSQADSNLRTLYRDRVKAERRRLREKHETMRVREIG